MNPLWIVLLLVSLGGSLFSAVPGAVTEAVRIGRPDAGSILTGKFTRPNGPGPHPAVVLISGLGPGDDVLIEHLAGNGIAVLKFDDRVVRTADGNPGHWTPRVFAEDALTGVRWLKGRREIDSKRLGLIGHSQGGVAAAIAAVRQPDDVAFVVLLAAIGVPVREWQVRQLIDQGRAGGLDEASLAKLAGFEREKIALVLRATDADAVRRGVHELATTAMAGFTPEQRVKLDLTDATIEGMAAQAAAPWFREFLAYDPRPTLRRVKCPVLALHGLDDLQVASKDNLPSVAAALKAGGNRRTKTLEFPGFDHTFRPRLKPAVPGLQRSEVPFDATALQAISDWVQERVKP